jgi:DNA-binding SARP family transcriptional activator/tetratricopeptide (TPR) repeat protein
MGRTAPKVGEHPKFGKPGRLEVRLFGHLEVALDGERFRLATPRKSLQVLAYLWLHQGAPVSREYLAFLLYPDDEESAARAKLRATLSELPKILPHPAGRYVSIDADKITWNPEADLWLDVVAFAAASSDRTRLAEAIDLYRGDLLPEIYDEWLDAIRERHRNAYVRCLTERVSQARSDADFALAIETARKVLAIDPWREDIVRRIVAMRYESGDGAGAMSEYAGFAQRLKTELGAEPMAETTAIADRIARGQALPEEREGELPSLGAGEAATLPFVGRRDEMGRLFEAWSRAMRGHGTCAFVGGESGIGKSRMVREFAHAIEDRGGRALMGATGTPEAVPYESIVDALRSALPLLATLKPSMTLACVATLVPELRARVALPDAPQLDVESERLRLFESVFRCFADLAAARPVLLVLEDLHWAQAATIELLQFLLRRISSVPALIVATYREEEAPRLHPLHRARREARATVGAQSLWLAGLSVPDVEALQSALPDLRDRRPESLITASHGNPLFLAQLVADLREGERSDEPASLQAVVGRRIERLSEHARTAAEIAACIGDRFSRDAVREVSAWDEGALADALDELLDRRIIREAGGRGLFEYAFAHHFLFETIVASVPRKLAATRHRRVARVLEELYPERAPELSAGLARHYAVAGDAPNAARCYLTAVRRAISLGALADARIECERGLALDVDPRVRAEMLLERVEIESRAGNSESWREALSALERACIEVDDSNLERSMLRLRIEFAANRSDVEACERAICALRERVPVDDAKWNAVVHLAESRLAFSRGRLADALDHGEAAAGYSRVANDEAEVVRALCFLSEVQSHRGLGSEADALLEDAGEVASRSADPTLELLVTRCRWLTAHQRRDRVLSRTMGERLLNLAVRLGDRPAEAWAHTRLGIALSAFGEDPVAAREHFDAALRIHRENGNLAGGAGDLIDRAIVETRLGFFERGRAATEEAVQVFIQIGDVQGSVTGLGNLVFLRACTHDFAGARSAAHEALKLARDSGFEPLEASALENLAFAEAAAGDYGKAIELAQRSLELRLRSRQHVWSSKTLADLAIWHAAAGNLPSALEAVRRLFVDENAAVHGSDWPSYPYWAAAQVFHASGRSNEASRALERARKLLDEDANRLGVEDRASFLAIPWHADLARTVATGEWPSSPR